jgi:F-type H+-transporting ATPase subunit b
MDINATLLGQAITFAIFIWFTMKYVWPPIMAAIHEREKTIADGLAASKKSVHQLEKAQEEAHHILMEARQKATDIITHANQRADEIVKAAAEKAIHEGQRLVAAAHNRIEQDVTNARQSLRGEVVDLALASAKKLLGKNLDDKAHRDFINKVVDEI